MGAMQAGAIAEFIGVPVAVAIGGTLVTIFALGPAMMARQVRSLSETLRERDSRAVS